MGAVNLDNTGSGAAVTLSSDGTALLLNGSAIGGGGGGGASAITISNKTGAYTVVAGDLGTIINCSGATSFTVSLTAAATLGSGFNCWIWNNTTTATMAVTIDPNGAETIDGTATLILRRGEGLQIICDGTNWQTGDKKTMRVYAENITNGVTRPTASGVNAVVMGNGTASGTGSFALGFFSPTASATNSFAFGANSSSQGSQAVTGSGAMALGGSYASGSNSFAAGVADNSNTYGAQGSNGVAIGSLSRGTATHSVGLGRASNASATQAIAVGGNSSASVAGAVAIGASINIGFGANASGTDSFAFGDGAAARETKKVAFAGWNSTVQGGSQSGLLVVTNNTTNATATVLTSDTAAASTTNQVILPNNSAYAFSGIIVSRRQAAGGTESAAWKVEGLIRREGTAASTTLVASTVTAISNVPGWTLALSADTTKGGLAVTFTGAAATNIRTVATIQTSEVTYA